MMELDEPAITAQSATITLLGQLNSLGKILLKLEARLASMEAELSNPRRGWVFQPDRFYALEEIERRSGYIPNTIPGGVAVVDIRGDYSQYEFEAREDGRYRLVRVDGMELVG